MISLRPRTEAHVKLYFERTQNEIIRKMLPSAAKTMEDAMRMFGEASEGKTASYGRTIYMDEIYVGDIWCYGMDSDKTPNAMLSFCIFDPSCWGKGICSKAVELFWDEIKVKFNIHMLGAFTYEDNAASRRVLEKNGFLLIDSFVEAERESCYYEKEEFKDEKTSNFNRGTEL